MAYEMKTDDDGSLIPQLSTDAFREHLRDKMEDIVGTRDLERANRRAELLHEWREKNAN